MSKFWIMGGAAIAISVVAIAWGCQPVRSTESLLGKAQAEFAVKARDALIQRRMAQASPAPVPAEVSTPAEVAAPPSVPQSRYVVASLEPVAAPVIAAPATPVASETAAVSPEAPVASPKLSALPELAAAPSTEDKRTTESQIASLPETPAAEYAVAPKPAPVITPAPASATVARQVVTPTGAARREAVKAAYKPTYRARPVSRQPRTAVVARRTERDSYGYSVPYNLQALRAHAPEIAAAIARYM
jgi:hypothetical protein